MHYFSLFTHTHTHTQTLDTTTLVCLLLSFTYALLTHFRCSCFLLLLLCVVLTAGKARAREDASSAAAEGLGNRKLAWPLTRHRTPANLLLLALFLLRSSNKLCATKRTSTSPKRPTASSPNSWHSLKRSSDISATPTTATTSFSTNTRHKW